VRVDEAELGRGHPELDVRGGDAQVAAQRELEAAADRVAGQRRDRRQVGRLERVERGVNGWATSFSASTANTSSGMSPMS
jgi:hypothetical protein